MHGLRYSERIGELVSLGDGSPYYVLPTSGQLEKAIAMTFEPRCDTPPTSDPIKKAIALASKLGIMEVFRHNSLIPRKNVNEKEKNREYDLLLGELLGFLKNSGQLWANKAICPQSLVDRARKIARERYECFCCFCGCDAADRPKWNRLIFRGTLLYGDKECIGAVEALEEIGKSAAEITRLIKKHSFA